MLFSSAVIVASGVVKKHTSRIKAGYSLQFHDNRASVAGEGMGHPVFLISAGDSQTKCCMMSDK
jgi:purine-nucleoside phosphorylase